MKNMATKMSKRELLDLQLHRRNKTRLTLVKDKMGVLHIDHPDNNTQWKDWGNAKVKS